MPIDIAFNANKQQRTFSIRRVDAYITMEVKGELKQDGSTIIRPQGRGLRYYVECIPDDTWQRRWSNGPVPWEEFDEAVMTES